MTGKDFLKAVSNGSFDMVRTMIGLLEGTRSQWCVIGGVAVNAYAEPVVSLDVDVVVETNAVKACIDASKKAGLHVEIHEHSLNLSAKGSDLRIQIQLDSRYQAFLSRAATRRVLGYDMPVAAPEDVLQGKIWAWSDESRRPSKRQKDLADMMRMIESLPSLAGRIPEEIKRRISE